MADRTDARLDAGAVDGDLDLEDVAFALQAAQADGVLSAAELSVLRAGLKEHGDAFEPAARRYLEAVLAGQNPTLPNRVLLAPHPKGAQKDLFYPRAEVVALQESLGRLGPSVTVDGDYGPGTSRAVAALQTSAGLPATGMVDSATLHRINALLEARGAPLLDLNPRAHIRPDAVVALRHGANTDDNLAVERALNRLAAIYDLGGLSVPADGRFDDRTEAAVKAFQRRVWLPETGIVDTSTVAAMDAALRAAGVEGLSLSPPEGGAGFGGEVELHFYPGDRERKLYVLRGGRVLDTYGMVGGQAEARPDPNNPTVDYSPSPEGTYDVVEVDPHASLAWAWSYVPYGAPLRLSGGEVQFRDVRGRWQWATGSNSAFAGRNPPPLGKDDYFEDGELMPRWTKNDFGHLRARLRSVRTGALQGHMIHPGPVNEETAAYFADTDGLVKPEAALETLRFSHGCEHIHPRDMDELVARGYLAPGTRFVVHGYDEVRGGVA